MNYIYKVTLTLDSQPRASARFACERDAAAFAGKMQRRLYAMAWQSPGSVTPSTDYVETVREVAQ